MRIQKTKRKKGRHNMDIGPVGTDIVSQTANTSTLADSPDAAAPVDRIAQSNSNTENDIAAGATDSPAVNDYYSNNSNMSTSDFLSLHNTKFEDGRQGGLGDIVKLIESALALKLLQETLDNLNESEQP